MEEPHNVRRGRGIYCSKKCHAAGAARTRKAKRLANIGIWFWEKVDRSGGETACWPWQASGLPAGYGRFLVNGHHVMAHRTAYSLTYGPIPDGSFVCHHCDNPPCCNPSHLFLGDHSANMRDRQSKGRYSNGEKHHAARLSQQDVDAIRVRLTAGEAAWAISRDYPVHPTAIYRIRNGKTWRAMETEGENHE